MDDDEFMMTMMKVGPKFFPTPENLIFAERDRPESGDFHQELFGQQFYGIHIKYKDATFYWVSTGI